MIGWNCEFGDGNFKLRSTFFMGPDYRYPKHKKTNKAKTEGPNQASSNITSTTSNFNGLGLLGL